MKKMVKRTLIIFVSVSLILLIILGIVLALILIPGVRETAITGCTGQILSIDSTNLDFNGELQKDVIRIVFSTVESGECAKIRLDPDKINTKLKESGTTDFIAKDVVLGNVFVTLNNKEFGILSDTNEQYKKFGIKNLGDKTICTDSMCIESSPEITSNNLIASLFDNIIFNDCTCLYEKDEGIGGKFSSGKLKWQVLAEIGGNGAILSDEITSGKIGEIAVIKWGGNFESGKDLEKPGEKAYQKPTTNKFVMVGSDTFSILKTEFFDLRTKLDKEDDSGIAVGRVGIITEVRGYNSEFESKTKDITSEWWKSEAETVGYASIKDNKLVAQLKDLIQYPIFTLDIDALEVGIFITTGKPQVTCPSTFEIVSGDIKDVNVKLKNIGEYDGSFSYTIKCNKGSQSLFPTPPLNVKKGQTEIIKIRSGLTIEESKEQADCKFTATEQNTFEEDSCTFSYSSTKRVRCEEGKKVCEVGNTQLWICQTDGSWSKRDCEFGCIDINGAICHTEGNGGDLIEDCRKLANDHPLMGYSIVKSCGMNPLCWTEITKPKSACKPLFLKYWILGGIGALLIFIIIIVILIKFGGRRQTSSISRERPIIIRA